MPKQKQLPEFPASIALFLTMFLIFQLILYVFTYQFQEFTMIMFFLSLLIPIGSFIGFFFGIVPSLIYVVSVVVSAAILAVLQPFIVSTFMYLTIGITAILTIIASFANLSYQREYKKLKNLQTAEQSAQVIDPITKLSTEQALVDLLVKQSHLAKRYEQYTFTIAMIRLDFIQTTKNLLGKHEYAELLSRISMILQSQIRVEDYKFSVQEGVFILLLPLTPKSEFNIIDKRIKAKITEIELFDRNRKLFIPTIRSGVISYEAQMFDDFQNWEVLAVQLQRQTEIDIEAEY
ncbi:MAG: diguanylate cyclase domain-containing protein [Culicoidibacterales bacterium]